jgi:hypothetical protein
MAKLVATPLWGKCEDETCTSKSENLKSFETPETSERDCKSQNTSHWGVIYTLERSWSVDVENGLAWTFRHLQHKLWLKEGSKVKLAVWLSTTKSWESTRPRCVRVECKTLLKSSWGELQVCFRPHPNQRSELGVMSSQSPRSPNRDSFGTPPWESRDTKPFGCRWHGQTERILYGGRWWLPLSSGHVSQVNPCYPWLVPTPRVILNVN